MASVEAEGVVQEPARVSFVVPTRNSGKTVERCLRSISEQDHPDVELVVVDNFSQDSTAKIAKSYTALVAAKGPERSAQRNYGAHLSSGRYIVFIDSDMVLSPTVATEIAQAFDTASTNFSAMTRTSSPTFTNA